MNDNESIAGRIARATLALAGPVSWPTLFVAAATADHFGHPGDGLGLAIVGLGVILLIHLLAPLCLLTVAAVRKRRGKRVGWATTLGLIYYALAAVVALIVQGPPEMWKDARVLTNVIVSPFSEK